MIRRHKQAESEEPIVKSNGTIRLSGTLKKIKTGKDKYFVLKEDTPEIPAQLEYYDSEKKFRSGALPRRVINVKACFDINAKNDTKAKHAIALWTKADCLALAALTEEDKKQWLNNLLTVHKGEDDDLEPHSKYEHVWQVDIQKKDLGDRKSFTGPTRLCLFRKTSGFKAHEEYFIRLVNMHSGCSYEFSLKNVKRLGDSACFFMMCVGRLSPIGAGELWMLTDDALIARNIHETIRHIMNRGRKTDPVKPEEPAKASTTSTRESLKLFSNKIRSIGSIFDRSSASRSPVQPLPEGSPTSYSGRHRSYTQNTASTVCPSISVDNIDQRIRESETPEWIRSGSNLSGSINMFPATPSNISLHERRMTATSKTGSNSNSADNPCDSTDEAYLEMEAKRNGRIVATTHFTPLNPSKSSCEDDDYTPMGDQMDYMVLSPVTSRLSSSSVPKSPSDPYVVMDRLEGASISSPNGAPQSAESGYVDMKPIATSEEDTCSTSSANHSINISGSNLSGIRANKVLQPLNDSNSLPRGPRAYSMGDKDKNIYPLPASVPRPPDIPISVSIKDTLPVRTRAFSLESHSKNPFLSKSKLNRAKTGGMSNHRSNRLMNMNRGSSPGKNTSLRRNQDVPGYTILDPSAEALASYPGIPGNDYLLGRKANISKTGNHRSSKGLIDDDNFMSLQFNAPLSSSTYSFESGTGISLSPDGQRIASIGIADGRSGRQFSRIPQSAPIDIIGNPSLSGVRSNSRRSTNEVYSRSNQSRHSAEDSGEYVAMSAESTKLIEALSCSKDSLRPANAALSSFEKTCSSSALLNLSQNAPHTTMSPTVANIIQQNVNLSHSQPVSPLTNENEKNNYLLMNMAPDGKAECSESSNRAITADTEGHSDYLVMSPSGSPQARHVLIPKGSFAAKARAVSESMDDYATMDYSPQKLEVKSSPKLVRKKDDGPYIEMKMCKSGSSDAFLSSGVENMEARGLNNNNSNEEDLNRTPTPKEADRKEAKTARSKKRQEKKKAKKLNKCKGGNTAAGCSKNVKSSNKEADCGDQLSYASISHVENEKYPYATSSENGVEKVAYSSIIIPEKVESNDPNLQYASVIVPKSNQSPTVKANDSDQSQSTQYPTAYTKIDFSNNNKK